MMNRREFFRRASLIAAGIVAADQLDLLERLSHRKVWAGHSFETRRQFVAARSGDWDDPRVWQGGHSPPLRGANLDIVIPNGLFLTVPAGVTLHRSHFTFVPRHD